MLRKRRWPEKRRLEAKVSYTGCKYFFIEIANQLYPNPDAPQQASTVTCADTFFVLRRFVMRAGNMSS